MTPPRQTPSQSTRRGFTLVELLVVILIMSILIALLVPAIASAVKAANDARVTAEIANMQTALADFKNRYGEFPPSRIALHNNGVYSTTDPTAMSPGSDVTLGDINARTARAMKKYFPRAGNYFLSSPGSGATPANWPGLLPQPDPQGGVILQGHECLVFFLGGMPEVSGAGLSLTGFSKDPVFPFKRQSEGATNRTAPLYEFAPSRLQDVYNVTTNSTNVIPSGPNGFPSYIDPLSSATSPRPYAYFSSYGNNGYDPNDDDSMGFGNGTPDSIEYDDTGQGNPIYRTFYVSFPVGPANAARNSNIATSTPPNPYTSGVADATVLPPNTTPPPRQQLTWINPQSFQLMSAGRDGLWGLGGTYDATSTSNRLPAMGREANLIPGFTALRTREKDNLTNFSGGKLD